VFVVAALAREAVWLLERFVDFPRCVSWVALTFICGLWTWPRVRSREEACR